MSKPTKEEWQRIDEKLSHSFGMVDLMIDGYKITLAVQNIKRFEQAIVVYVNGKIRGEWFFHEPVAEEAQRFWKPEKKYVHSQKLRNMIKRMSSKKRREEFYPGWDKTFTFYQPSWKSFKALKAHLLKNNESIELVTEA